MMRTTLLATLIAAAFLPAIASAQRSDSEWLDDCRHGPSDWDKYCEVRVAGFRAGRGALSVDARDNGSIYVHAWDRDSVEVHERVEAQAESPDEARAIGRDVRVSVSNASIRAEGPSMRHRKSWSVSYDIYVPAATALNLEAMNGGIGISGTSGNIDARTVNGPLSLSSLSGEVHARTSNGPLTVSLTGHRWEGGSLDAETINGPASVTIPDGYNAHLVTGTVNGPMRFDFPITLQGRITHSIDTNLGSGGPTVRAMTTNGPLVLRRS